MKKVLPFRWLLPAMLVFLLFPSCVKDKVTRTYKIMQPVFADKSTVLADVKSSPAKSIAVPGKIFIKGNYLFVNDVDHGIHIIDNSNPSHPAPVAFINIPGNIDVAVKGNYLYADMYTDLLAIDITDPLNVKLTSTHEDVFPERNYGRGWSLNGQVIVDWIVKDTTVEATGPERSFDGCASCLLVPSSYGGEAKANYVPGISGSMARMIIMNDYLYTVNQSSLMVFNIDDPSALTIKHNSYIGFEIQTIYPFKNNLFIGSSSGMFIYDVTDPLNPQQLANFAHARRCDPVVTDGDYAYVTLRSGDECAGTTNELDVVNIKSLTQPWLVKKYAMAGPNGVGKDGDLLFVCDGKEGIKVYNAADVTQLQLVHHIEGVDAYDVIPWSGRLLASTKSSILQYDYNNPDDIKLLSEIRVGGAK